MTCICGNHFCFKCGAGWDMKNYKCSRGVNCPLWEDDDMLLAEDQRRGRVPQEAVTPEEVADVSPIHHPVELPPPPPPYQEYRVIGDFDWIHDNAVVVFKHQFTSGMIRDTTCGYCYRRLTSLADLQYHLVHVRRHPVYSCCGKFFRLPQHFQQHQDSACYHDHTCVRNDDNV